MLRNRSQKSLTLSISTAQLRHCDFEKEQMVSEGKDEDGGLPLVTWKAVRCYSAC